MRVPTGAVRPTALLLASVLAAATLTGCTLLELTRDCEGTAARLEELAALDILGSRPDGATPARGFEEVDAGCWADSGEVVVHAERVYAFPGTRVEVAAHYRKAAARDGWEPDGAAGPDGLCFVRDGMALWVVPLTAESLMEDGLGGRSHSATGAGYSIGVETHVDGGSEAGC
ncbi:hypothetical protein J5J01_20815 [Streptomyces fradiae]|uniref:hypothetical protein n=1 Tax=Streptomyces fradiae TaxID=1906 RepID=UPI0020189E1A|nr:hypothetical protein [Streptomyces fradiae]UQS29377.1 hypothetical protein J5J01_20815 [Streptomyces fradiae]